MGPQGQTLQVGPVISATVETHVEKQKCWGLLAAGRPVLFLPESGLPEWQTGSDRRSFPGR